MAYGTIAASEAQHSNVSSLLDHVAVETKCSTTNINASIIDLGPSLDNNSTSVDATGLHKFTK